MQPHGSRVGPAYAAECKDIALGLGLPYILEAFGRVPNNVEKGALLALLIRRQFLGMRVAILRQGAQGTNAHQNDSDDGILNLGRESSDFRVNSRDLCCSH